MADELERESEQKFARVFFMRGTPATYALIGANVAVFVLMAWIAGTVDPISSAYSKVLIAFGARLNDAINQGEYWRFVNPIFIHFGPIHLFVNMYSLYAIGPQVERLYGTARFLILYLLSGIAGVVASYLFGNPEAASAGASGALFGLLGVLLVFGIRFRSELPGMFRQAFSPKGLIPVLALNLLITFAVPFIDEWGHLGGLFGGAVLAAVVPYFRSTERRAGLVWRFIATACVVVTITCFVFAFVAYRKNPPRIFRATPQAFIEIYNSTNKAMIDAVDSARRAADGQAILPDESQKARDAAAKARADVALDAKSEELLAAEAALLDRIATLIAVPTNRPSAKDVEALGAEKERLDREWDIWLEQTGVKFGVEKTTEPKSPGGSDAD